MIIDLDPEKNNHHSDKQGGTTRYCKLNWLPFLSFKISQNQA
jgi:hypothetical protein